MDTPREIVLLGSTGSVGSQALAVVRRNAGRLRVVGIAAGGAQPELLAAQAREFGVPTVAVADPGAAEAVRAALPAGTELLTGPEASAELATRPADLVLNGLTGSRGLGPTLAALRAGRMLALANKESLVAGGPLVRAAAAPGQIIPVDSEHSALAQCLRAGDLGEVRRLVVTATGGPFRGQDRSQLGSVTVEQALAHPTWNMGPMVTINSATLINKGLEVIEAHELFDLPYDRIDVVIHRQAIVHSMVEYVDGSTIAQLSPPDMRIPIALALGWPDRLADAAPGMDWAAAQSLDFEPLDDRAFPAVTLARDVGSRGGVAPAIFNAANEEAVGAFVEGRLPFLGIVDTVAQTVADAPHFAPPARVEDVLEAEGWARSRARELVGSPR